MKAARVVLILLAATILPPPSGYAQQVHRPVPDPGKALSQYLYETWSVADGLPQNTVEAVTQTRDGYLWIGTEEGLARFDGLAFDVFNQSNTPALERNHGITALQEGPDGTLWIGTNETGLVYYRDGRIQRLEGDSLAGNQVQALALGPDSTLWMGAAEGGLLACQRAHCRQVLGADLLPGRLISELYVEASGTVWIGTDQGLVRLRGGSTRTFTTEDGLPDHSVTALHPSGAGGLWIGTAAGVARVASGRVEAMDPADGWPAEGVWALLEDAEGSLWMGLGRGGLARRTNGRFDTYGPPDGLSHGWVLNLLVDREGNLWIGSEAGGLTRLRDALITTFTAAQELPSEVVNTVFEDEREVLWIGTDDGSLSRLQTQRVQPTVQTVRRFEARVTSVYGHEGDLWVGTQGDGLYHRRGSAWQRFSTEEGLPGNQVFALHTGRTTGDLWIGTNRGVARWQGGRFDTLNVEDGLSSNFITVLWEDQAGTLWVGTYNGGLNRVWPDGRVDVFRAQDGLGSDIVSALYEDADGTLWIGTYGGGLVRYQGARFARFTPRHGFFNDKVYQILEDESGWLWMGCNLGIFRVKKAELHTVAAGRQQRVTSFVFDTDNGMKSREVNGGVQPAGWKGKDGRLWFPTISGLSVVDPSARQHNAVLPPVFIESVQADGGQVLRSGDERAELPAGTDEVTFEYAALSFVDPHAVRYRYRLEGDETNWSAPTSQRDARYTHLAPGRYTFRVMAMNNDGVWNEEGASLTLYLHPFFWQTFWFWSLVGLTMTGLATGGYKWRVRYLKDRQRQLERVVAERTSDLRAAKDQIEAQAGTLKEQADELRASLSDKEVLLREIHHRVKNNMQVISSLLSLQAQKVENEETLALFKECRHRVASMAMIHEQLYQSHDLARVDLDAYLRSITDQLFRSYNARSHRIALDVNVGAGLLGVDQAISCGLIVNELVSNALKHAFPDGRPGRVAVLFEAGQARCRLAVRDDGVGLPAGFSITRSPSLGLKLVQALAKKLQGTLHAYEEDGAVFEVDFPSLPRA